MEKQNHFKNYRRETYFFNQRLLHVAIFLCLLIAIILVRLFSLQVVEHKAYSTLSKKNLLAVLPLPPKRGLIYDRNGILIAKNVPSFTLVLTPSKIKDIPNELHQIKKLIPLSVADIKNFSRSLNQHRRFDQVPIKLDLTETQIARFEVNRFRFPGVSIKADLLREYPQGSILSSVLGYVGRINPQELSRVNSDNYRATNFIGKVGIERYYEPLLHGTTGNAIAEINANGQIIRYLKKSLPTPGQSIHLSIDSRLQRYIYTVMGNNDGAVVAIDPRNGQVLAMVSNPSYDPNPFVTGLSNKAYHALLAAPNHPLYNRSIRGLFSPGSTIKPFYAVMALSNHLLTNNNVIFDPGWYRLPHTKHIYHDWKRNGHGWVNVTKAITVSCDTFFYNLAVQMGIKEIDTTLNDFGFGQLSGIDLKEELPGIVPTPQWKLSHQQHPWYTGDTIITGIGQGSLLVTPLQLASATGAIAERGKRFQPHLLLYSTSTNTKTIDKPILSANTLTTHHDAWHTVINAMEQVIRAPKGTAINFGKHTAYLAAGKTGTAQVYGKNRDEEFARTNIPKRLRNNHLFIVFAPAKHPTIALAVVIEHAGEADGIARHILDYYFKLQYKPKGHT